MPDTRQHRGPHPEDGELFARERWGALQEGVHDLSWLLSRGYALPSSLKIVGDRFALMERQRLAVMRSACSDDSLALRTANCVSLKEVAGGALLIDGYNLLTTVEAALGHAVLLHGRDYCLRDLASMHGHYKRVAETGPALGLIGKAVTALGVSRAHFLLDAPVSNSGRLKKMMEEVAWEQGWGWEVTLLPDPDPVLAKSGEVIVTADSVILDGARNLAGHAPPRWLNLALHIVSVHIPDARIVPMAFKTPWGRGVAPVQ